MERYSAEVWRSTYADLAHPIAFGGEAFADEPFDFALLCIDQKQDKPAGYMTCVETRPDLVYLKHGGGFPSVTNSILALPTYMAMVDWLCSKYDNLYTKVQNFNVRYLKMAMAAGLLPVGVMTYKGDYHVELALRKDKTHYAI